MFALLPKTAWIPFCTSTTAVAPSFLRASWSTFALSILVTLSLVAQAVTCSIFSPPPRASIICIEIFSKSELLFETTFSFEPLFQYSYLAQQF